MQKRDFETYQKRFRDFEILLKFSETHVFRGTIRHPSCDIFNLQSTEVSYYYLRSQVRIIYDKTKDKFPFDPIHVIYWKNKTEQWRADTIKII